MFIGGISVPLREAGRERGASLMPKITIGVPVFNAGDLLHESLSNIAEQTFADFKVVISDNGSTDATEEIARKWVREDPRFTYSRRQENVGPVINFRDLLLAADTDWFMWRADDDLSAPNFLETLYEVAISRPGCGLAVGTVITENLDGSRRRVWVPPFESGNQSLRERIALLLGSHPSWFYGLWNRQTITNAFIPICERIPYAFASDHLTLYGPIIDGCVRTTRDTHFIQRYRRTASTPRRQTRMKYAVMSAIRSQFTADLKRQRSDRDLSSSQKLALAAIEPLYLHHALPSLLKMWRTRLRELTGTARAAAPSRNVETKL